MGDAPSRAITLFGTEEKVDAAQDAARRAADLRARRRQSPLRQDRRQGGDARDRLHRARPGTGAPTTRRSRTSRSARGRTASRSATRRSARMPSRSCAIARRIKGDRRRHARASRRAPPRSATSSPTAPASSSCIRSRAWPAGRSRCCTPTAASCARRFPELIDPMCPFQDIRALTHEVLPGVRVTCTMQGDAFEMEDHRNWNDASYKTYVRPLAKPWPYTIEAGETTEQSVTLAIEGSGAQGGGRGRRGTDPARRSATLAGTHARDRPEPPARARRRHARGRRPDQAARAAVPGLPVRFADRRRATPARP